MVAHAGSGTDGRTAGPLAQAAALTARVARLERDLYGPRSDRHGKGSDAPSGQDGQGSRGGRPGRRRERGGSVGDAGLRPAARLRARHHRDAARGRRAAGGRPPGRWRPRPPPARRRRVPARGRPPSPPHRQGQGDRPARVRPGPRGRPRERPRRRPPPRRDARRQVHAAPAAFPAAPDAGRGRRHRQPGLPDPAGQPRHRAAGPVHGARWRPVPGAPPSGWTGPRSAPGGIRAGRGAWGRAASGRCPATAAGPCRPSRTPAGTGTRRSSPAPAKPVPRPAAARPPTGCAGSMRDAVPGIRGHPPGDGRGGAGPDRRGPQDREGGQGPDTGRAAGGAGGVPRDPDVPPDTDPGGNAPRPVKPGRRSRPPIRSPTISTTIATVPRRTSVRRVDARPNSSMSSGCRSSTTGRRTCRSSRPRFSCSSVGSPMCSMICSARPICPMT